MDRGPDTAPPAHRNGKPQQPPAPSPIRQAGCFPLNAHEEGSDKTVLCWDHDLVIDGTKLARPVNYSLVRIRAPEDVTVREDGRPYIIIDPRAGHGSGIGGFKHESEVGVAIHEGHPVYFVTFTRLPQPGQTIADVTAAEADFVREVRRRHPDAPRPFGIDRRRVSACAGRATAARRRSAPTVNEPSRWRSRLPAAAHLHCRWCPLVSRCLAGPVPDALPSGCARHRYPRWPDHRPRHRAPRRASRAPPQPTEESMVQSPLQLQGPAYRIAGRPHRPRTLAPWPKSTACSLSDLFALGRPALHLPRYPRYHPGEALVGDYDYFFLRSERYLSCQAARFLLLGGDFITLADAAAVDLSADVSAYWSGFYREHFARQIGPVLRYAGPTGYRQRVAEHPGLRVVSPHPFDSAHVPAERYYLDDPALSVRLNAKGRLHELTDRVPAHESLSAQNFTRGHWRERWEVPFVIKLAAPAGGGDGVVLCRGESDVREASRRFVGQPVKIEQYVQDSRNNYNVQIQIDPDGELAYIGGSVQRVCDGAYLGNCIDLHWVPPARVAAVCDQAARAAARLGWHGVAGLDLIEDRAGEVWLIDPNFRLNSSTPFFLLADYLRDHHRRPQLTTGYFCYPGTPAELFDRFRREIHRCALVPVGAHFDPRQDGLTRLYAAVVSDGDPQDHAELLRAFAAKQLRAGIGL